MVIEWESLFLLFETNYFVLGTVVGNLALQRIMHYTALGRKNKQKINLNYLDFFLEINAQNSTFVFSIDVYKIK